MTERNPAVYLQAGSHSGEDLRLAQAAGLAYGSAVNAARSGVRPGSDLQVSAQGTPNMTVAVAAGQAFIQGSLAAVQGAYAVTNDASVTKAIGAADPTNPRNDLIVAQVQDAAYSGATNAWSIAVVQGAPASTPVDPATPANAIVLARVRVNANAVSIVGANITDLRPYTAALGGTLRVRTTADLPTTGLYDGLPVWIMDVDKLVIYTGSGWSTQSPASSRGGDSESVDAGTYTGNVYGTALTGSSQATISVNFTAPDSGCALLTFGAACRPTAGIWIRIGVRVNGPGWANVDPSDDQTAQQGAYASSVGTVSRSYVLRGLTPGGSYTLTMVYKGDAAGTSATVDDRRIDVYPLP